MRPKEIIKILNSDGWQEVRQKGSHKQFHHPTKKGTVTVPIHPGDLEPEIVKSILSQAGIK